MAIYFKPAIEKRLRALDEHYEALRKVLEGSPPMRGVACGHGFSEEVFANSRVWVDFDEVLVQLDHFKAELAGIKAFKKQAEKPGH